MAVTVRLYNHTTALIAGQTVDLDNLKVMLLDDDSAFDATDTTIDAVSNTGAYEVFGNGWTEGGETLTSVTATTVTTNDALIDADDVDVTATGGNIGPAYAAVIYDATSDKPLKHIDFGQAWTAGETTPFKLRILAGLFNLDYTVS